MWKVVDTGENSPLENMKWDAKMLDELSPYGDAVLHFYEWNSPSLTYGYFVDQAKLLQEEGLKKYQIQTAKRPTGGGVVFHLWDLAFSVLIPEQHEGYFPSSLDNYKYINEKVLKAVQSFQNLYQLPDLLIDEQAPLDDACQHFCMARPTKYDVMLSGKKIAGAAQRKKKNGYLHQGTISLKKPSAAILDEVLKKETMVLKAMQANTHYFFDEHISDADFMLAKKRLKEALEHSFLENNS